MIKFKAWNASNSRAIAKFHNTEIGHFGHNAFIHELIRGPLINAVDSWCKRMILAKQQSTQREKQENENVDWEVTWQYQD